MKQAHHDLSTFIPLTFAVFLKIVSRDENKIWISSPELATLTNIVHKYYSQDTFA